MAGKQASKKDVNLPDPLRGQPLRVAHYKTYTDYKQRKESADGTGQFFRDLKMGDPEDPRHKTYLRRDERKRTTTAAITTPVALRSSLNGVPGPRLPLVAHRSTATPRQPRWRAADPFAAGSRSARCRPIDAAEVLTDRWSRRRSARPRQLQQVTPTRGLPR
jgi:hypothetical protein